MPQTYRIKLSDGREFDVKTDGGPPSEQDVLAGLGQPRDDAPKQPDGSAVSRFASNAWEMLNPVSMAKAVWNTQPIPEALGGAGVMAPIDRGKEILASHGTQLQKARDAFKEGRYSEMLGHGSAAALPMLGPVAADTGEQIASGDVAGGLGRATGMLAPFGMAESLARLGVKVTPMRVADALDAKAAANVADVMSPKSATMKGQRMTAKAEKIAPKIAAGDNAAWSRSGLRDNLAARLEDARGALDDAADARNDAAPIETKPILDALKAKRAQLTAEPFDAVEPTRRTTSRTSAIVDERGQPMTVESSKPTPIGEAQTPAPNRARAAVLDKAIAEVEALGDIAPYESLRTIRAAYDGPAEVRYNPAVTPDFLANQSNAIASADVAGAIRETLATSDPTTAAANADFSLYKSAHDIVTAAEELDKARPKNGRRLMSQLTGSLIGKEAGGAAGAVAGFALGPIIDNLITAGVTTKLKTAQLMTNMAKAIRGGNQTQFLQLQFKLRDLARQAAKAEVTRGTAAQATQQQSP